MIPKKPKLTESQFLSKTRGTSGTTGTNGGNGAMRPRLPEDLVFQLRQMAGDRRMNVNALIVELLEEATRQRLEEAFAAAITAKERQKAQKDRQRKRAVA
jgi:hypothetical protein